jgi:lipopolysaccharide export system protein LptA
MKRFKSQVLTGLLTLLVTAASPAQQNAGAPDLKITSDEIDCTQDQKKCTALGNARAEKLNTKEPQIITAETMIAHFNKIPGGSTKLHRLEAHGDVVIIHGEAVIRARRVDYDVNTKVAQAFEDVTVSQDKNQLEGTFGEVNMATGEYKLRREGGQVDALIYTKDKKASTPPIKADCVVKEPGTNTQND